MAMGEIFSSNIEGIAAGGAGLARLGPLPVFVEFAAPGDTLKCRITEEHPGWARAEVLEIIAPSPDRAEPACPFYGRCGGCSLQHLSYEAQLAAKTAILTDAFKRIGGFSPHEPKVFPSRPWEYRNRMQFHCISQFHCVMQLHSVSARVRQEGSSGVNSGDLPFGLKARKSDEIIGINDCPIADPGIRDILRRSAAGEKVLSLPLEKNRFTVYARNGLLLNEGGTERGSVTLLDRELKLDAGVFFQSNGELLEKLIVRLQEVAASVLDRSLYMADLYCGVGTFAAFLGESFPRVDLLEENKKALALARENVRHSGAEFFALKDEQWARMKKSGHGKTDKRGKISKSYSFALADPPRQGLSPALSHWLASEGPHLLAYVSCDPATLARDSKILRAGGYELVELDLYDFYPQTAHIESLAVFRKELGS